MLIKQLIALANKLDDLGYTKLANNIDSFIKHSQVGGENVSQRDLDHAVEFYNNTNVNEVNSDDLTLEAIVFMEPKEFLPELDVSDKGWLKTFPTSEWIKVLTEKYGRGKTSSFANIVNMFIANKMSPAVQINGVFGDGMARTMFYNALGQKMPVAKFTSSEDSSSLI